MFFIRSIPIRCSGAEGSGQFQMLRTTTIAVDRSPLLIEDTESAGIYRLEGKDFSRRFAVNALSRDESDTRPAGQRLLAGRRVTGSHGPVQTNKEIWRWLLIAVLALVTLEWAAYHRRP